MSDRIPTILDFWFGAPGPDGMPTEATRSSWFKKDSDFDEAIHHTFRADYDAIVSGENEAWLESAEGTLAYVLVLDQFARNMFRNQPEMYAADTQCLSAVKAGIEKGYDQALEGHRRVFLYMPFMHSEDLKDQNTCIRLFEAFRDASSPPLKGGLEQNVTYAKAHQKIVARFGRFPHRNDILTRESTPEELEFLKEPRSSF